jgi:SCP-2 sterol transfer family protein
MTRQMTDHIEEFFDHLASAHQPLLEDVASTLRIDVDGPGGVRHWMLRIDHGSVDVSRRAGRADASLSTDLPMFEKIVTGEANPLTGALRGRVQIDGDLRTVVAFQRLMPSPPGYTTAVPPPPRSTGHTTHTTKTPGATTRARQASASAARTTRRDRAR